MTIKLHSSFAVHPGAWLRVEIVQPHGLSVTMAAQKLGVTRQAMSNVLGGRAGISAEMALRFEQAFGLNADTLLRMQAAHDMAAARARAKQIKVQRVAPLQHVAALA
jgi:addiction module HigA family antidote